MLLPDKHNNITLQQQHWKQHKTSTRRPREMHIVQVAQFSLLQTDNTRCLALCGAFRVQCQSAASSETAALAVAEQHDRRNLQLLLLCVHCVCVCMFVFVRSFVRFVREYSTVISLRQCVCLSRLRIRNTNQHSSTRRRWKCSNTNTHTHTRNMYITYPITIPRAAHSLNSGG